MTWTVLALVETMNQLYNLALVFEYDIVFIVVHFMK